MTTKKKRPFKTDGYKKYDTSNGFGDKKQWKRAFWARMTGEEAAAYIDQQEDSPYKILGIAPGATKQEILRAFRTKIKEWHPDRNEHRKEEAHTMSQKIIAAYTILNA